MAAVPTVASRPNIDELVRDLGRLCDARGLEMMIRVGSLIVDRLYEGDATRWRSHRHKDTSFRKLASHPDLPFQASTLSRAVGIYLLAKRSPQIAKFQSLGPSHLQEVLGLSHHQQDRLLQMAEAQRWSTRRLRAEVRIVQSAEELRILPKRMPAFQTCLERWRERVEGRALVTDLENIGYLDVSTALDLLTVVRMLCQQSEALARRLSMRLTDAGRSTVREAHALAETPRSDDAAPQHSGPGGWFMRVC